MNGDAQQNTRCFTCCFCGGTFTTERTEKEVMQEFEEMYGSQGHRPSEATCCDDCWKERGLDTGDMSKWRTP